MRRQTRKLILNIATGVAIAATAAVVFTPAIAAPATATSNVNVRSGPGPGFGVVDQVRRGQPVDVGECQGSWCFISKPGPDGWVSSSYLSAGGGGVIGPVEPGIGIQVGPGGVSIGVGTPRPVPPVIDDEDVAVGEVCFYDRTRYRGGSFCMEEGESIRRLGEWNDRIRSFDNPDGLEVRVCYDRDFRGCRTFTSSASQLGEFDEDISSIRVR